MPTTTRARLGVPVALAALTVFLQVLYPLVEGNLRDRLTVLTVVIFLSFTLAHAAATRGTAWAFSYLLLAAGTGLAAEAVGVATGLPFGDYTYGEGLGWTVLDVPVAVPLAWAMFAYPCLLVGQRLGRPLLAGAWALASWDLFLDPQMVDAGHWRWLDVEHPVPGLGQVPFSNLAGWTLVSLLLMTLLSRLPAIDADDRAPVAVFLWTYGSSVLANVVFFERPGVALVGGLVMGGVAAPLVRSLR